MSVAQLLVPNALDLYCRSLTVAKGGSTGGIVNTPIPGIVLTNSSVFLVVSTIPSPGVKIVQLTIGLTPTNPGTDVLLESQITIRYGGADQCINEQVHFSPTDAPESESFNAACAIQSDGTSALEVYVRTIAQSGSITVIGTPTKSFLITSSP